MSTSIWTSAVSGDWSNAADWTGGVPNSLTAGVQISVPGTYTVDIAGGESFSAGSIGLNDAGATLQINGTLTLKGALNLTAGSLYLGGTINGGAINAGKSAGITFAGGTLAGVTWAGALTIGSGSVNVSGGLTLTGAGGSGAGSLNVTGGTVTVEDSETLNNAAAMECTPRVRHGAKTQIVHLPLIPPPHAAEGSVIGFPVRT
jgi:hypothetical protein